MSLSREGLLVVQQTYRVPSCTQHYESEKQDNIIKCLLWAGIVVTRTDTLIPSAKPPEATGPIKVKRLGAKVAAWPAPASTARQG